MAPLVKLAATMAPLVKLAAIKMAPLVKLAAISNTVKEASFLQNRLVFLHLL